MLPGLLVIVSYVYSHLKTEIDERLRSMSDHTNIQKLTQQLEINGKKMNELSRELTEHVNMFVDFSLENSEGIKAID